MGAGNRWEEVPRCPGSSTPDSVEGAHPTLPAVTLSPDLLGTTWHSSALSLLLPLQAHVFVALPSRQSGGQVVPRWCERQPSVGSVWTSAESKGCGVS